MIRFLSTLVHRKERKAGLFRSYVDFWKLGSICLWFASARTCVRACVRVCVCACACSCVCVCLVISNSLGSHGLQPTRLLCALNFPGKHTGVGCHFLLQGIFLTQGLNPSLLHYRQMLYHLSYQEGPKGLKQCNKKIRFSFYKDHVGSSVQMSLGEAQRGDVKRPVRQSLSFCLTPSQLGSVVQSFMYKEGVCII